MDHPPIFILGIGRNTPVYIDLVEDCGFAAAGLYHFENHCFTHLDGIPVLGTHEDLFALGSLEGRSFALSMGDNRIRSTLAARLRTAGGRLPTLIHSSAVVSRHSELSDGVAIHAHSTVHANAKIGPDTVISYGVGITHDCRIDRACYLAAHSVIGANVHVHEFAMIGMGAIITSAKVASIGENAVVGAGSVVIRDVPANAIVAGNPARILRSKQ